MSRLRLRAVVRAAAFGLGVLLLGATLVLLIVSLQFTAELRQRLRAVDEQLARLSQRTSSDAAGLAVGLDDISARLSDVSRAARSDIGSVRASTRSDLAHLREGLSGRLDEVARRVTDLGDQRAAAAQEPAVVDRDSGQEPTARSSREPGSAEESAPQPASPDSAERDLSFTRQAEQGKYWFACGQYERARLAFARLVAAQPQDPGTRLYYAASLFRSNPTDSSRYAQVEKHLRSVLTTEPGNLLALDTLAALDVERGRWEAALDELRQLNALQPAEPRYPMMAGFCAREAGDLGTARDFFAAAVSLRPADADALAELGDCQWALGSAAEACRSWEAALAAVDPGTPAGSRTSAQLRGKIAGAAPRGGAQ